MPTQGLGLCDVHHTCSMPVRCYPHQPTTLLHALPTALLHRHDSAGCKLDLNNLGEGDKQNGHLTFSGTSGEGTQYALDLQLYGSIDKEKSKVNVLPRHIFLVLEKSEAGSWPRLTKEAKGDHAHIKVGTVRGCGRVGCFGTRWSWEGAQCSGRWGRWNLRM